MWFFYDTNSDSFFLSESLSKHENLSEAPTRAPLKKKKTCRRLRQVSDNPFFSCSLFYLFVFSIFSFFTFGVSQKNKKLVFDKITHSKFLSKKVVEKLSEKLVFATNHIHTNVKICFPLSFLFSNFHLGPFCLWCLLFL